jgi:hypothetical protein
MNVLIRPATPGDCFELATNLRADDVREIRAATGQPPLAALLQGVDESTKCYIAEDRHHRPFVIFGVADDESDPQRGVLWMLATDELLNHKKTFVREARRFIREFFKRYSLLGNVADQRNTTHIKFLNWLGATWHATFHSPVDGSLFREFRLCA